MSPKETPRERMKEVRRQTPFGQRYNILQGTPGTLYLDYRGRLLDVCGLWTVSSVVTGSFD